MNRDFHDINQSLPEQLFEEVKIIFQKNKGSKECNCDLHKLPKILQTLKISIPETMMKDYLKTLQEMPSPKMSFKQFTHYIARASLENEIEQELRNLFNYIDKEETGSIDAKDLYIFLKSLEGGEKMSEKDVDNLMKEIDLKQIGFLGYEEFVYILLPK